MKYTNSSLVTDIILSPFNSGERTHEIDTITIHCMAGHGTAKSCGKLFQQSGKNASSNYGVDDAGNIGLYVEEKNVSWCTSNSANDNRAITIEVASDTSGDYAVTTVAYNQTIRLVADICIRNKIKKLKWTTNKGDRMNHINGCNMTVHRDYANKACPGNFLYTRMGDIAKQANKLIKTGKVEGTITRPTIYASSSSNSNSSSGSVVANPSDVINANAIDALVISLTTKVTNTDYKKLLKNHVSGVILKAGSYFTADHKVAKYYRNQNLQKQIDQAVKAGVRFGLYADVRAKTVAEAKLECEQLYYTISRYPPALGLWLHLAFTTSKKTNHKILDYYLSEIKRWGLTKGCGVYCTKKELEKIDWKKYQDDLFLWYVKRFSKDSELAQLEKVLTPEFFKR